MPLFYTIGDDRSSVHFQTLVKAQEVLILYNQYFCRGKPAVIQPYPKPQFYVARFKARLAWNNWPDSKETRRQHLHRELVDEVSADAWDRVIEIAKSEVIYA